MKATLKTLGITTLAALTALAPLTTTAAQAGERHWNRNYQSWQGADHGHGYGRHGNRGYRQDAPAYRHRSDRRDNSDAIALGIIGLGAAVIIGGAIANANQPRTVYQAPPAPQPMPVARGAYEPWTQSWMRYCSSKYRSFNASTGTYRGYDGQDHFCVAD